MKSHPWQQAATVLLVAVIALQTALHGWPTTLAGNAFTGTLLASGLTLLLWHRHQRAVAIIGATLWLAAAMLQEYGFFPDSALIIMPLLAAVAALAWSGRAAWGVALVLAAYLMTLWLVLHTSPVALLTLNVPGFVAGTVLRLRREAADELARRAQELAEEQQLFADLTLRHERARIAAELHDIVGHAISVMIIQAAAGQRLADRDPVRTRQVFDAIAGSARQGRMDLQRLVDLLGGTDLGDTDFALVEDLVAHAAVSGLDVTCRYDGDHEGAAPQAVHLAFRVVQESVTNALRYAQGAAVRVLITGERGGLTVRVENGPSTRERLSLGGSGSGLAGLRDRIRQRGGRLQAGPTASGGWLVEATLPPQRSSDELDH
ncbi:sensor histidine kinase [Actinokineospora sp. 24-640]